MKIFAVFGTRPEAIKMCPVIIELRKQKEIDTIVCVTGQHREMLEQILDTFHIVPEYNLNIMKDRQTLFDITKIILSGIEPVLKKENPDIVLVHGDTSSAFATALACYYMQIPVAHIEAGLRTYNIKSPYPEEFNRQAIDSIADILFAPTINAKNNLLKEGKKTDSIFVTGNTVIDALKTTVKEEYSSELLEWAGDAKIILITAHRRENVGQAMYHMFLAIKHVVDELQDVKVIYPIHFNPAVRKIAYEVFGNTDKIRLVEPLNMIEFHNLMNHSYLIMTDSGGIQEEAPSLGKPVLVMRDTTERPEGVEAGTLKLVGTESLGIEKGMKELLLNQDLYEKMSKVQNPYGDGRASERIVKILQNWRKNEIC